MISLSCGALRGVEFTNVECVPLGDVVVSLIGKPGLIDSVTIADKEVTVGGIEFPSDASATVAYHSKAQLNRCCGRRLFSGWYRNRNTNTRKFHVNGCRSISQMKAENRQDIDATREEVIAQGYDPCGICHP